MIKGKGAALALVGAALLLILALAGTALSQSSVLAEIRKVWLVDQVGDNMADQVNDAVRVNVVAGAAGGGVAQTQVRNSGDTAWVNVGLNAANAKMPSQLFDSVGDSAMDDTNNAARVNCVVGCGASGFADNAAFTFGTTTISIDGYVVDDVAPNAATENSAAAPRMGTNRILYAQLHDGTDKVLISGTGALNVTCDNCGGSTFADNSAFTFGTSTILNIGAVVDEVSPNSVAENSAGNPRMAADRILYGNPFARISTGNSSTATLGISGVFTGTGEEVKDYATITVQVKSDVASATNGLSMQYSTDNTNWDDNDVYTIDANTGKFFTVPPQARYFRVVYTNGGTAQTFFRLQTIYHPTSPKPSSHRIADIDAMTDENDAELVLAFVTGTADHDEVDNGRPVKIGGRANSAAPAAVAIDDRVNAWFDLNGRLSIWDGNLTLSVDDGAANLSVDWAGTPPPIGAGLEATALRVTIATDSTGLLSVDDNGGSLTVDAVDLDIRNLLHSQDSVRLGDGTDLAVVTAAGALGVDIMSSINLSVLGTKSNNAGAPGATNLGTLPALATAAVQAWTEGNQVALSVDLSGRLRSDVTSWLGSTAPTVGQKTSANSIPVVTSSNFIYCNQTIAINQTASTSVIAGVASQKIFICSIMLISATAQNLSITAGTGSVCATGENALIGGTTASVAVAANGGFSMVSPTPFMITQDAADGLCVEQSGAGNVSGTITYLQQVP